MNNLNMKRKEAEVFVHGKDEAFHQRTETVAGQYDTVKAAEGHYKIGKIIADITHIVRQHVFGIWAEGIANTIRNSARFASLRAPAICSLLLGTPETRSGVCKDLVVRQAVGLSSELLRLQTMQVHELQQTHPNRHPQQPWRSLIQ
jgi:hypothetical protein